MTAVKQRIDMTKGIITVWLTVIYTIQKFQEVEHYERKSKQKSD